MDLRLLNFNTLIYERVKESMQKIGVKQTPENSFNNSRRLIKD